MTTSEEDREQAADEVLLLAIASGDAKAFETFLGRYLDRIHGYLLRLTGAAADAEGPGIYDVCKPAGFTDGEYASEPSKP